MKDETRVEMTAAQKRFVREKLIPFILRDHGRGFAMQGWIAQVSCINFDADGIAVIDGIDHPRPACDTICCIGGSISALIQQYHPKRIREALGLSDDQADALFYHWDDDPHRHGDLSWSKSYREAFAKAKTPLDKAKVACQLLEDMCQGKKVFDAYEENACA